MAKWQFDLEQDSVILRTYGGSKGDVYCEIDRMLQHIGSHLKCTEPYEIHISKANRPCGRKHWVESIKGEIGQADNKKKKPRRAPRK